MDEPSLLELFVRPLATSGIPYFITGGVATIIYGEPRFTRDIDLVIAVHAADAPSFLRLWPASQFYAPPLESFERECERPRHGHFNLIHQETGLVADCYVAGDDPLHALAFSRRRVLNVSGLEIQVAPVEYVIARKLSYFAQAGSTRHLEDVVRICRVQGDLIDQGALSEMIRMLDVFEAWQRAVAMLEAT